MKLLFAAICFLSCLGAVVYDGYRLFFGVLASVALVATFWGNE